MHMLRILRREFKREYMRLGENGGGWESTRKGRWEVVENGFE